MKKRVILTTVCAAVLFLAAVGAGLNAVFTVTSVQASFSALSETGIKEAKELQKELDGFVGKSTTFLDTEEIRATVEKYPCFKIEGKIEKRFPQTIVLNVAEREEVFAVWSEERGKYAVLDADGIYLYDKDDASNRLGGQNIVLTGFSLELRKGEAAQGEIFSEFLAVFREFESKLGGVRRNLASVQFGKPSSQASYDYFSLSMQEGVAVFIDRPSSKAQEKAQKAIGLYFSLDERERTYGEIFASENPLTGEITAKHNSVPIGVGN